jgi:hypothetical protein
MDVSSRLELSLFSSLARALMLNADGCGHEGLLFKSCQVRLVHGAVAHHKAGGFDDAAGNRGRAAEAPSHRTNPQGRAEEVDSLHTIRLLVFMHITSLYTYS